MKQIREKVMDLLVDEKIFILSGGPFKTSGGLDVPFYVDFRRAISNPEALNLICEIFAEKMREHKIDAVGGIETTGIPLAAGISLKIKKPFFWLRGKIRDHGLQTIIAGKKPDKKDKIAIVDDSVGGGGSIEKTIENLRNEGCKIVLFAYIMEGDIMGTLKTRRERLEKEKIACWYIATWKEWVKYLLSKERISQKLADYCYEFIDNPLSFDKNKLEQYNKDFEGGEIWIGKKT